MGKLDGRVALVTGGARGQGRSHALALAREGADIIVCDIADQITTVPYAMGSAEQLDETVKLVEELDRRCIAVKADVRDATQVKAVVEAGLAEFGSIDILLANAGIMSLGQIAQMPDDVWHDMIDVNLTGVFYSVRAVLPHMIEAGYGRIVVTSSQGGLSGFANIGHYVAAKWGLIGLVKAVALEVAADGITVNAVCPTNVDTGMIHHESLYKRFRPDVNEPTREDVTPVFRSLNPIPVPWIAPQDVSDVVLFLVSDQARYITGDAISVAAGYNASH
jgi:SDR family mycofactocin-dependent oxidoreductase